MARSLTMHRTVVTPVERAKYLETARAKARHYQAAGCRYWVFEEAALPGAFVEFCEANDAGTLSAAHAAAPGRILDPSRVYSIVELD
ncbi:MAG: hypothetical protein RL139_727 [Gemmatimonadota bacterium]|jgi:hypothetical protein